MADMIKEALQYVNPKPVEEAVPAKGAKKPPPKGKVEEAPADPFEGLITEEYKAVANKLKSMLE